MAFTDDSRLDTSGIRQSGGGGRGMAVGGGIGGVLIMLVAGLLFGQDGINAVNQMNGGGYSYEQVDGVSEEQLAQECQTGADANSNAKCNMVGTKNSLDAFWQDYLLENTGVQYSAPALDLFQGQTVRTGCGTASESTGPFYCPADKVAYVKTSFFDVMKTQLGAEGGQTAEQYVLAHEYGHHIQNQLGNLKYSQYDPQGADSGAVRVELQADCYAGVWAGNAAEDSNSPVQVNPMTEDELNRVIDAADKIGDDHIQMTSRGHTDSSTYTHGTSAQRVAWYMAGYNSGDMQRCDTFAASDLDNP